MTHPKATESDNLTKVVRYGVWHPTKGWMSSTKYGPTFQSVPHLLSRPNLAKQWALTCKGQLVVFDVTPVLRSWPSEEGSTPPEVG